MPRRRFVSHRVDLDVAEVVGEQGAKRGNRRVHGATLPGFWLDWQPKGSQYDTIAKNPIQTAIYHLIRYQLFLPWLGRRPARPMRHLTAVARA
jgi:hypothetical protein